MSTQGHLGIFLIATLVEVTADKTDADDGDAITVDGDIGRMVGKLLYIDSRARDMILHNGENVYPVEIEYRLDGLGNR